MFAEGGLHPLGDKPLANAFNRSTPDMEGFGNGLIGGTRIGVEQDMGARQAASRDGAFLGQVMQGSALIVRERDDVFLAHAFLPFSGKYTRDRSIHQNHCGRPLDGFSLGSLGLSLVQDVGCGYVQNAMVGP